MYRFPLRRAALAFALVAGLFAGNAMAQSFNTVSGVSVITKPSEERKISFATAGVVKETLVKDGDRVKAGDVLLRQDMDLDQKELERLEVEANSESRIKAAEAELKVRQIDYEKKTKNPNAYTSAELDEAEARKIAAEKGVDVAREEQLMAKIRYEQQKIRLTKMETKVPSDVEGQWIVQQVVVKAGEMADPQSREGAAVLVKNDPLKVEIRGLTTLQVSTLKIGQKLQVRYLNEVTMGNSEWKEGTIAYITPVADAGADRQVVRLDLPNPENRAAGLRMELNWTDELKKTAPKDPLLSLTNTK